MASGIQSTLSDLRLGTAPTTAALATLGSILALSAAWVISDYHAWVHFGTGGTPPTPAGYWKMTKFRWAMFRSTDDMRDPSKLSPDGPKYLDASKIPANTSPRPKIVSRTMPQRQMPDHDLDDAIKQRLHALAAKYASARPDILVLDKSKTEGFSTDAVYAKPDLPGRDAGAKDRILGNEIAHVHHADSSLHVWLSPPDAKVVVEKGWGERFPLSSLGMTHQSWVLLYAPRRMEDVDVVEEIVRAGIAYLTGEKV